MIDTSMIDVDDLVLEDTLYYDDLDVSIEVNLMLAFTPYILHCYWNEDIKSYDFAQLCRDYNFDPDRNVMIQLSEYEKLFYLSVKEDIDKFYDLVDKDFVEDFSGEKDANEKEKNKEVIVDDEFVSVMKEIDSISDDLDDLLM